MDTQTINIEKITFQQKPIPIPVDYRPTYKISIIILTLKLCSSSETASLLKLHLFSWSLKSDLNRNKLKSFILSNYKDDFQVWNIEPALNRALQYCVADKLCDVTNNGKYKLTEKGDIFYNKILETDVFKEEIEFLKFVGKNKITDNRLNSMTKQWRIDYE